MRSVTVRIKSYEVGLKFQNIQHGLRTHRRIHLNTDVPRDRNNWKGIWIDFSGLEGVKKGGANDGASSIKVWFPENFYNEIYHLIQSERPLLAMWDEDSGNISTFQIQSWNEPIGEGQSDTNTIPEELLFDM